MKLDWDMEETAAMFLGLAIAAGAIAGFGPSRISKDFLDGCKKMLSAAFIIGMATAIGSILTAGNIIDTVFMHWQAAFPASRPFFRLRLCFWPIRLSMYFSHREAGRRQR